MEQKNNQKILDFVGYKNSLYENNERNLYIDEVEDDENDTFADLSLINICKDTVKKGAFIVLLNYLDNIEYVENIPYRRFHDLAITYKVELDDSTYTTITNKVMDEIGMEEAELYEAAHQNTPKIIGALNQMEIEGQHVRLLNSLFDATYTPNTKQKNNINDKIILHIFNPALPFGASILLYSEILDGDVSVFDDDLLIAAPSADFIIVTAAKNGMENIKPFFQNILSDTDEILSTSIYLYSKNSKRLTIASAQKTI